jgi:hypothetical protein
MAYDPGYPAGVTDPENHVVTQGEVPGADLGDWPEGKTAFIDYIHASEGGVPGTAYRNGYTSGIQKFDRNVHHFTGRSVLFVTRDLSKDGGPVGTDNYRSQLVSGVNQQFLESAPSLEDIYYGITGRG